MTPSTRIKIGISACLLGEKVRYDGAQKFDQTLINALDHFVEWVPVCPEVESGLSVPRERMRLIGDPAAPRLEIISTDVDYTEPMIRWTEKKLRELEGIGLSGFIFKSRSPSCGLRDVEIFLKGGGPANIGAGIFAGAFINTFRLVPVEDEVRLSGPGLREKFVERIQLFSGDDNKNIGAYNHTPLR